MTYTELQASVASWMHRTDLTAVMPTLIALAEDRIARDLRLRAMLVTAPITAGQLPADWLQFKTITADGNPVEYITQEQYQRDYAITQSSPRPVAYSITGTTLSFGQPNTTAAMSATYYIRFPKLQSAGSNWLSSNHSGIYLYGTLGQAALYTVDDERAGRWFQLYEELVQKLQSTDDAAQFAGPMRINTGIIKCR